MQLDGKTLLLSATDLSKQIACRHLIGLERAHALGRIERPYRSDPFLERLLARGLVHERDYVERLRAEGRDVADLREFEGSSAAERTLAAMREGAGAIVQGTLRDGRWQGRADVLLRVSAPDPGTAASLFGPWSYEVVDTKLAQETRGGTILQLCLYSDLLARAQGREPARMHVVKPGDPPGIESFRFEEYAAYYRLVRRRLETTVDAERAAPLGGATSQSDPSPSLDGTYPEPVPHCEICPWWTRCDRRRRDDDHLSFVAGMQSLHRGELVRQGILTLEAFGDRETPLPERPERGSREAFERLHGQARIQLRGRREGEPVHETFPLEPGRGLTRLPEPSRGDVYFDLESNPFVGDGGLEYLFGWACQDGTGALAYRSERALDRAGERRILETFVDAVLDRWRDDPGMHVYHFSPYEPAALKRLMGRHATRESAVDRLLRGRRFVDLHAVTRQGVRASVEQYSLKDLEAFTGYRREIDLRAAREALHEVDAALELGAPVPPDALATVERYNRDDCLSTAALHAWLERVRGGLVAAGAEIPRPELSAGDPSGGVEEKEARVREVFDRLVADLPEDRETWSGNERARWLLAHLLEYFRREDKCAWWEYFRLQELDPEDRLRERKTIQGLEFRGRVGGTDACPIHRYGFPLQEAAFDPGDRVDEIGGEEIGKVHAIDHAERTIDIKKKKVAADRHPLAILANERVPPKPLDTSLLEFARSAAEHGVDGSGPYRAARDLLLKRPPRMRPESGADGAGAGSSNALRLDGESAVDAAMRLVRRLDGGTLAIQGPPGSGKTYVGARMIVALAAAGRRVGVTAVSHKVIRNLLDEVLEAANEMGAAVRAVHKTDKSGDALPAGLEEIADNEDALAALDDHKVVGGTAWLWARDDAVGRLDTLFVDEAGQIALAPLLACGRAARNLVLLGDPRQLEQPQRGAHPEGSGVSGLEHLLDGHDTIPDATGLFLDRTWRLHPRICEFTSEVYYERRLESRAELERQALAGTAPFERHWLFYVPVPHAGNQNTSAEEVEAVARIAGRLLQPGAVWIDATGERHPMTWSDVLVVAPYNAHVGAIARRLPQARVGTVDKFQGQEAPVVVYAMGSSSVEDAPRGMEFLFSPNRLNVATSRARCACILVASPALLEPDCRTPAQIRWANGLCRFLELSRTVEV